MIIDMHTHLWPASSTSADLLSYFEKRKMADRLSHYFSAEGLLELMEKHSIAGSVVSAIPLSRGMKNEDLAPFNDHVEGEVVHADGKLMGFCTVDPLGGAESVRVVRHCIEERGFRGLKLHPCIQEFYPYDERVFPLYETMQEFGLPILMHTGGLGIVGFRDRFGHPEYLDDVACLFPGLPIIMGHGGRLWYDETAILLRKHPNIYADISTNFGRSKDARSEPLTWMLDKVKIWAGSLNSILYGSDYPFYFQDETFELLRGVKRHIQDSSQGPVTGEELDAICEDNPSRFCERYGLSFKGLRTAS
jgi:predicted TIM-barrel fold metal-dependent hydrolase